MTAAPGKRSDLGQPTYAAVKLVTPAAPDTIGKLRHRAAGFAAAQGAPKDIVAAVALAVSEAVTNVVRYAYGPRGGTVELAASTDAGWLEICVRDSGSGFVPGAAGGLGFGLTMIATLCTDLTISQESTGTEVLMRWALPEL